MELQNCDARMEAKQKPPCLVLPTRSTLVPTHIDRYVLNMRPKHKPSKPLISPRPTARTSLAQPHPSRLLRELLTPSARRTARRNGRSACRWPRGNFLSPTYQGRGVRGSKPTTTARCFARARRGHVRRPAANSPRPAQMPKIARVGTRIHSRVRRPAGPRACGRRALVVPRPCP